VTAPHRVSNLALHQSLLSSANKGIILLVMNGL
jgi:hypothetical protein